MAKYCKDCQFYVPGSRHLSSYCGWHASTKRDLESGELKVVGMISPQVARNRERQDLCGPAGRYFQQKQSWWKFWKRGK